MERGSVFARNINGKSFCDRFWKMPVKLVKHVPLTTLSPARDIVLINDASPVWKMTIAGFTVNVLAINTPSWPIPHWHYILAAAWLNPSPSSPISDCSRQPVMCGSWAIASLLAHQFRWVASANSARWRRNFLIILWHWSTARGQTTDSLFTLTSIM